MDETDRTLEKNDSNRANALKSTGPKSEEGKRVSRWNALKHGLLAKEVVIQTGENKENLADFQFLLGELRESLEPMGILEEMQVEQIAVSYWRWNRVLRYEAGEITAAKNSSPNGKKRSGLAKLFADKEYGLTDSQRVQERINVLEKLKQEVGKDGTFSGESQKQLIDWFGLETAFVDCLCIYNDNAGISKKNGKEPAQGEKFERYKQKLLGFIEHEKGVLGEVKSDVQAKEELERKVKIAILNLPPDKASEKIIRYETTIERRMHRAMEQLGRLQRERRGGPTLPALNVNLNAG